MAPDACPVSIGDIIALFAVLAILAAVPSASVALVVTRSATLGKANGIAAAIGIVTGDLVFIGLAILGLSALAETLGGLFTVARYLGAAYLIWLGYSLLTREAIVPVAADGATNTRHLATSGLAGLLLTLGDVKAILFYASLLPAFVDPTALRPQGTAGLMLTAVFAIGGVKLVYALSANRLAELAKQHRHRKVARRAAGGLVAGTGTCLLLKT